MGQLESSSTCLGDLDDGSVFTFVFSGYEDYGQRHTEHRATGWYVRAECILPTTAAAACLIDAMVIECRLGTCRVLFGRKRWLCPCG